MKIQFTLVLLYSLITSFRRFFMQHLKGITWDVQHLPQLNGINCKSLVNTRTLLPFCIQNNCSLIKNQPSPSSAALAWKREKDTVYLFFYFYFFFLPILFSTWVIRKLYHNKKMIFKSLSLLRIKYKIQWKDLMIFTGILYYLTKR